MMTPSHFDLLRERRSQLGEAEPDFSDPLRPLLQGTLLGGVFTGLAIVGSGLVVLLSRTTADELRQLSGIQTNFDALQAQIVKERTTRKTIDNQTNQLVRGVVAIRSGSALLEDLRRRAPKGVQLTDVKVDDNQKGSLVLKGLAYDPNAFARVNALQLELKRSPLFNRDQVRIVKSQRDSAQNVASVSRTSTYQNQPPPVAFEITAAFSENSASSVLSILQSLNSDGMVVRLKTLQRQGFF